MLVVAQEQIKRDIELAYYMAIQVYETICTLNKAIDFCNTLYFVRYCL